MRCDSMPFSKIERRYVITSKELKAKLGIVGTVIHIDLWKGRSPNDVKKGVSADKDEWEIATEEI